MTFESAIIDLTSRTPSGGICRLGDVSFQVWYCSDCWEWEFQGVYYFDPLDLSEAIEAFLQQPAACPRPSAPLPEGARSRPRYGHRKAHAAVFHRGAAGMLRGRGPADLPRG